MDYELFEDEFDKSFLNLNPQAQKQRVNGKTGSHAGQALPDEVLESSLLEKAKTSLKKQSIESAKKLAGAATTGAAQPQSPLQTAPCSSSSLARSPLRLQYEAEVAVIRQKLGSPEQIRQKLGLSRRKLCRLLLVDPSAWSRWTKEPLKVPFYVYRALQWYLALIEKDAAWHPAHRFGATTGPVPEISALNLRIEKLERKLYQRLLIVGFLALGIGYFLGRV